MREFTFNVVEEETLKVELWNHYGGSTEKYLAGNTFETVNDIMAYIEKTLDHYNYHKEFYLEFRGKKYSCSSKKTIFDILT